MSLDLSEKRLKQLQNKYIADEVRTIRLMTEIYCHAHHGTDSELCEECQAFFEYARKRLACCPYGDKKPVCKKCRIHCFGKDFKTKAKEIMAYSGPRLMLRHPILSLRHIAAVFREAPEKPGRKTIPIKNE